MKESGFSSEIGVPSFFLEIKWLPALLRKEGLEGLYEHRVNFSNFMTLQLRSLE
jgi:hypothetical protein